MRKKSEKEEVKKGAKKYNKLKVEENVHYNGSKYLKCSSLNFYSGQALVLVLVKRNKNKIKNRNKNKNKGEESDKIR